jgi:hypothetical protein
VVLPNQANFRSFPDLTSLKADTSRSTYLYQLTDNCTFGDSHSIPNFPRKYGKGCTVEHYARRQSDIQHLAENPCISCHLDRNRTQRSLNKIHNCRVYNFKQCWNGFIQELDRNLLHAKNERHVLPSGENFMLSPLLNLQFKVFSTKISKPNTTKLAQFLLCVYSQLRH